jgi:hypothetical protein
MDRNGVGRARLRGAAERRGGHAKHIAPYPQQRRIAVYVYGTIRPIYLENEGHPSPFRNLGTSSPSPTGRDSSAGVASRYCMALCPIGVFRHKRDRDPERLSRRSL